MSKYGSKKTTVDGIVFDSKREATRWCQLLILERIGQIRALKRQVAYELAPSVKFAGATRAKPALRYMADFTYWEGEKFVAEDSKGVLTEAFQIKRHLMLSVHGLDVRLTK